jgi:hypothetical protein
MAAGKSKSATNAIKSIWQKHSLSIVPAGSSCYGSFFTTSNPVNWIFFGNAIADWTDVIITILQPWVLKKDQKGADGPG